MVFYTHKDIENGTLISKVKQTKSKKTDMKPIIGSGIDDVFDNIEIEKPAKIKAIKKLNETPKPTNVKEALKTFIHFKF